MRKRKKSSYLKELLIEYINENSKLYILIIIIFFIGLSIGIICINNTNEESQKQISLYINNFTDTIKAEENISANNIILGLIKNNIIIVSILCFLGCTVIGIPLIYMFVLYKGYSFGYTISSIFATLGCAEGLIIASASLVSYLIYIPAIISISVSGINLYRKIINNRREKKLSTYIFKHIIFCIIMLCFICVASIIEGYMITWVQPIIIKHF